MYVVVQFALCPNLMLAVVSGYVNLSHFLFYLLQFQNECKPYSIPLCHGCLLTLHLHYLKEELVFFLFSNI